MAEDTLRSGKKEFFSKSVFTLSKPYSKTFIYTTEINGYLIVTYLKPIFFATAFQSISPTVRLKHWPDTLNCGD